MGLGCAFSLACGEEWGCIAAPMQAPVWNACPQPQARLCTQPKTEQQGGLLRLPAAAGPIDWCSTAKGHMKRLRCHIQALPPPFPSRRPSGCTYSAPCPCRQACCCLGCHRRPSTQLYTPTFQSLKTPPKQETQRLDFFFEAADELSADAEGSLAFIVGRQHVPQVGS